MPTLVLRTMLTRLRLDGVVVIGKKEQLHAGAKYLEPHGLHSGVYRRNTASSGSR